MPETRDRRSTCSARTPTHPEPIKRYPAAGAAGAAIHSNKGCRDKDATEHDGKVGARQQSAAQSS